MGKHTKIIKKTNIIKGIPNPGDIWSYKIDDIAYTISNRPIYMRIRDKEGSEVYFGNSPNGDMFSVDLDNGEIVKTKIDDPRMEVFKHAEVSV